MMIRSVRVRVPPRVVQRASSSSSSSSSSCQYSRRSMRRYVTNDHISSSSSLTNTNNNGCSIQKGTRQFSSSSSSSSSPSNSDPNSDNSPIQTQTVPTSNNNNAATAIPMIPINFDTSSSIQGDESQILQVTLQPNQVLRAESGAMIFMTQGVEMSTSLGGSTGTGTTKDGGNTNSNSNNGRAISDGFKRMLTGQNMFISEYTYNGTNSSSNGTSTSTSTGTNTGTGTVALGTDFPSKIIKLNLSEYNQKLICQKSSYLASDSNNVSIQMEYTKKLSIGFFGGEGFILQGLVGCGDVFVKVGGVLVMKELDIGEVLRISSGSLVAFTQDVDYDIQTMPGFKNVLFGGEGLFVTTLTGPGTVWLQGMPPDRMISEIVRKIPSGGIGGLGIPIGLGGGGGTDGTGTGTDGESEGSEGDGADSGADNGEDLVASTDAAIEADRNAAVASSGFSSNDVGDSESSSALFGDASPSASSTLSSSASSAAVSPPIDNDQGGGGGGVGVGEESDFTTFSDNDTTTTTMPDLDDSSSFSTDFSTSSNSNNDDDDYDDLTNNNQFDDFQQDETSFSTGLGDGGGDGDGLGDGLSNDTGEDGSSILNTLWDLFFDNDD